MIEHSVISRQRPGELWLLAHGIDPGRQYFFEHLDACDESLGVGLRYYDYASKVDELCRGGVKLDAAIEMTAEHYRVTSRTVRNARRYLKKLGAEK